MLISTLLLSMHAAKYAALLSTLLSTPKRDCNNNARLIIGGAESALQAAARHGRKQASKLLYWLTREDGAAHKAPNEPLRGHGSRVKGASG